MPLISIIIPTYNSEKHIKKCVDSVLCQTFSDYEVILVDGLSKDRTIDVIKRRNDKRIKIISESDKGIYDAMNKGIKKAKGDWLYFIGSDDRLYDNDILKNVEPYLSNDFQLVYGNVLWGENGNLYDGEFNLENLVKYKNICQQAIFYNKKVFKQLGVFNTDYKYCADHYFNILVFKNGLKTKYIDKVIAVYGDEGSSSKNTDYLFQKERFLMLVDMYEKAVDVYNKYINYDNLVKNYEDKIFKLKNSKDYRIGRIILSPIRFIKRLFQY